MQRLALCFFRECRSIIDWTLNEDWDKESKLRWERNVLIKEQLQSELASSKAREQDPLREVSELQRELREYPTKVAVRGELHDHAASTASPYAYEVYDYGEKEYGVNEGSLESDLLRLLDKIARRYNESAEGG